jgi:excisionase family DNA binding protein
MASEPVLTVREAADELGVSAQRVRQLVGSGALPARRSSSGWLVPAAAVAERMGATRRGRPVKAATAWAALRLLAGDGVVLDRRLRHHVRSLLVSMPRPAEDPDAWRRLLRARAHRKRVWAHPGVMTTLAADARVSPAGALALGDAAREGLSGGPVDLYVRDGDAADVFAQFALHLDPDGQVVLHVIPADVPSGLAVHPGEPVPVSAAAADLLDDGDARARSAAIRILTSAVDSLVPPAGRRTGTGR